MRQLGYVALCAGMCALQGCVVPMTISGVPTSGPQTEVYDYGPFAISVESAKWTSKNAFMIRTAIRNDGNAPGAPADHLSFQLQNAAMQRFNPEVRSGMSCQAFATSGTNIAIGMNPGKTSQCELVFDVPRDEYRLILFAGTWPYRGNPVFTWTLEGAR